MSRRQKALAVLQDELRTIEVFDRVHDYTANADPADKQAYAVRQVRRGEISVEIQKLNESSEQQNHARTGKSLVFPALAKNALQYLLKWFRW